VARFAYSIPLAGHALADVEGSARPELVFDDEARSRLWLEGPFSLHTAAERGDLFQPPCPDWVRDVLLSLLRVKVIDARYNRNGTLRVTFEDGRCLTVDDGPYENWHYSNANGDRIHGGVGRIS